MARRRGEPAERAALRGALGRWTDVVEQFARRRRGRARPDPRSYAALHAALIASCRSLAATADGPDRELARRLEVLARPWLSPETLARAERDILLDLLDRARRAEQALGGRRWGAKTSARAGLLFLLPAAAAVPLAWLWTGAPRGMPSPAFLQDSALAIRVATRSLSDLQKLFLVGLAILVASYLAVTRTSRS